MNFVANALLCVGASPVVSLYPKEIEELAGQSDAVYINIGCLDGSSMDAMRLAAAEALKVGIPWVLDPVAVSASSQRASFALELVKDYKPYIIRGNASEISALAALACGRASYEMVRCGVDSTLCSSDVKGDAVSLAQATGSVVAMSGEIDYVVSPDCIDVIEGGDSMMARVTATGCVSSALCAAFSVTEPSGREAAVKALELMKKAGGAAAKIASGPGSFVSVFLDELSNECR